jgi:diguanylate cyclase
MRPGFLVHPAGGDSILILDKYTYICILIYVYSINHPASFYERSQPLDELTGLLPRVTFLANLDLTLAACSKNHTRLVLVMMDIDHLMQFNEAFGHAAGDAAIQTLAARFQTAFSPDSLIGRYGGDEFAAAVSTSRPNMVLEAGEELCRSIVTDRPVLTLDGKSIPCDCGLSLGMATYPEDAANLNDLVEKAKLALYRAKEAGGNTVFFFEQKDGLTGLHNRNAILHQLESMCTQAVEKKENVSVTLFDIDDFANLNALYGHRFGDELLKYVANVLTGNFSAGNWIGRIGGDEFVVVMPDTRAETAFVFAEEVRKVIENHPLLITISENRQAVSFHVSAGVATFPADSSEWVGLLRKASEALYRAKQTGRNRICLPSSAQMITKTSYYTQTQLERLAALARKIDRSEAFLLREALDDILRRYDEDH